MISNRRQILACLGLLLCFVQYSDAANDPDAPDDKILAGLDYSVFRLSNATRGNDPTHLCVIDFIDDDISTKFVSIFYSHLFVY